VSSSEQPVDSRQANRIQSLELFWHNTSGRQLMVTL